MTIDRTPSDSDPTTACHARAVAVAVCAVMLALVPCAAQPPGADVPAAVVARTGPVELKLEVLRTRVKVGESLWVRLTLTNVGRKRFVIADDLFSKQASFDSELSIAADRKFGIYLPLVDASGNGIPLKLPPFSDGYCLENNTSPLDWKRATSADTHAAASKGGPRIFDKLLKPGESIVTPAGSVKGSCPAPKDIKEVQLGFTELPAQFEFPGHYRIKAVYDETPKATHSKYRFPDSVRVVTREIAIDVTGAAQ